jgi:hypothetical protein
MSQFDREFILNFMQTHYSDHEIEDLLVVAEFRALRDELREAFIRLAMEDVRRRYSLPAVKEESDESTN